MVTRPQLLLHLKKLNLLPRSGAGSSASKASEGGSVAEHRSVDVVEAASVRSDAESTPHPEGRVDEVFDNSLGGAAAGSAPGSQLDSAARALEVPSVACSSSVVEGLLCDPFLWCRPCTAWGCTSSRAATHTTRPSTRTPRYASAGYALCIGGTDGTVLLGGRRRGRRRRRQ